MSGKNNKVEVTVNEMLALLKNTNLPTIIVEGKDDMIVYRKIEKLLAHIGVDVLSVGGRKNVLQIFERRGEIPASVPLIFIADKDTWIYSGIPSEYQNENLLFTDGYSIENDIYQDGKLWDLLSGNDSVRYDLQREQFIEWYALALDRHLDDPSHPIKVHPNTVLDPKQRPAFMALKPNEVYPTQLQNKISLGYRRLIRGKSLFELLIKNTNARREGAHHTSRALFEYVVIRPGPLLCQMCDVVESRFRALISN
jgi:hypothetical protein